MEVKSSSHLIFLILSILSLDNLFPHVNSAVSTQQKNLNSVDVDVDSAKNKAQKSECLKGQIYLDGKCYSPKPLGANCTNHEECSFSVSSSWCHKDDLESTQGSCVCEPFNVYNENTKECLPYGMNGEQSSCKIDEQCTQDEALGPLSFCSSKSNLCECLPLSPVSLKDVRLFDFKCIEIKQLGDECETDQECEAGLGPLATCDIQFRNCSCQREGCGNPTTEIKIAQRFFLIRVLICALIFCLIAACFTRNVLAEHSRGRRVSNYFYSNLNSNEITTKQ